VSRRAAMHALWEGAGLTSTGTRVIPIPTVYADFNDFWNSNSVPVGPQGKAIQNMAPIREPADVERAITDFALARHGSVIPLPHPSTIPSALAVFRLMTSSYFVGACSPSPTR
jgi:hypothetical protein